MMNATQVIGGSRGANHSAQMDLLSAGINSSDLYLKNLSNGKLLGAHGLADNPGNHNNSQTSLRSQRSGGKRGAPLHQAYGLGRAQHHGTTSAVSPGHRSAANAKESTFHQ